MEFDPLYPAGFHDFTLDQMEEMFAAPFEQKVRRMYLINRFREFIARFSDIGIEAEIWLDGSFVTFKPEPNDIDVVFFVKTNEINALSPDRKQLVQIIFDRQQSKIRYQCDVFICTIEDVQMRSYWRGWFSFSREERPKGVPRLQYAINR